MKYSEIIKKGLELGLEEVELFERSSVSNRLTLFEGKVDSYNINEIKSLSIRGSYQGRMNYISTESFEDEDIIECLKTLRDGAPFLSSENPEHIYDGSGEYQEVHNEKSDFNEVPLQAKIDLLKEVETKVLSKDPRLVKVQAVYNEKATITKIINSKGLNLEKEDSYCMFYANVVGLENGQTVSNADGEVNIKFKDLDADGVVERVCNKVLSALGAGFVETGNYPAVFDRDVTTSILQAFTSVFSGMSAMRKMSILVGKEGQKVFGENITIVDDPFCDKALFKESFDDEGVPCKTKKLVENGIFNGFMHTLKTAKFMNVEPTGNGGRGGGSANPGPTNLYLQEGEYSKEDMFKTIEKGVYITEVSGLHAGLNPISGNFNVQSSGYLIENGKLSRPITLFVLSSNFFELLNQVEMIGNDIEPRFTGVAAPCIKVGQVTISGK